MSYPDTLYLDDERHWSGLQPDPLAEYLVGSALGPQGCCPTVVTETVGQRVTSGRAVRHGGDSLAWSGSRVRCAPHSTSGRRCWQTIHP